jgi:hypothetical protein
MLRKIPATTAPEGECIGMLIYFAGKGKLDAHGVAQLVTFLSKDVAARRKSRGVACGNAASLLASRFCSAGRTFRSPPTDV